MPAEFPVFDDTLYCSEFQLSELVRTGRAQNPAEGVWISALGQSLEPLKRLPLEGIFFPDSDAVRKAVAEEKAYQKRRADLAEYRRRWENK